MEDLVSTGGEVPAVVQLYRFAARRHEASGSRAADAADVRCRRLPPPVGVPPDDGRAARLARVARPLQLDSCPPGGALAGRAVLARPRAGAARAASLLRPLVQPAGPLHPAAMPGGSRTPAGHPQRVLSGAGAEHSSAVLMTFKKKQQNKRLGVMVGWGGVEAGEEGLRWYGRRYVLSPSYGCIYGGSPNEVAGWLRENHSLANTQHRQAKHSDRNSLRASEE